MGCCKSSTEGNLQLWTSTLKKNYQKYITLQFKELEKDEEIKYKAGRRKAIIKGRSFKKKIKKSVKPKLLCED